MTLEMQWKLPIMPGGRKAPKDAVEAPKDAVEASNDDLETQ